MTNNEFDAAIALSYPRLLRYARRLVCFSRFDAEDLLHSVLATILTRGLDKTAWKDQPSFEKFVRLSLDRKAWKLINRAPPAPLSLNDTPFDRFELIDARDTPEEALVVTEETRLDEQFWAETAPRLDAALALLSVRERNVVQRVLSGDYMATLAREQGVSKSYIGKIYKRALMKMRRYLVAQGQRGVDGSRQ